MPGTKVSYRQVVVAPTKDGNSDSPPEFAIIPHIESGWCQCMNAEYIGYQKWLLSIAVFEPVGDEDEQ